MQAPRPSNETARLAALQGLGILDTPPEERFDRITRIAQRSLQMPIALISLVDVNRQWFKSCLGLAESETPRSASFCAYALEGTGPLVIPDATADPRFAGNPLVTGPPHIRCYAGHPLSSPDGYIFGTLCVIDTVPRTMSPDDLRTLADLAACVEGELNNDSLNRALIAQRESEERFRSAFVHAAIGMALVGLDGRWLRVNRAVCAIVGYSEAELLATNFQTITHPDDLDADLEQVRALLVGEIADYQMEKRYRHRHGHDVWVLLSVSLVRDEASATRYFIAQIQDIDARKRAEEELRATLIELETQYRSAEQARGETHAVLDAASEGMALIAPDRAFMTVNRRFAELFDVTPAEVVGRRFEEFGPLVARVFADPVAFQRLIAGTASDTTRQFTAIVEQVWPQARELQLFSTPVTSARADFLGRLYVFRDVTRERELDRMKTEFVSMVSHELRTPLTSITGFVDLLLDGEAGELSEEQHEFLSIVKASTGRLVALVNDLLDISRIESGRVELTREPLDLHRLIRGIAGSLRPQIEAKGQTLTLDLPETLPNVSGDAGRVRQIVDKLLTNAHKYTPRGGTLGIAAAVEGDAVRVRVADSGVGLSPDEQAQVFDKFYRAHNRATREAGGTGLGLAIIRSLVEMHGGQITLESAPDAGSTFSFTLPLADEVVQEADAPGRARWGSTILVIDRDRDIADLLRRYLDRAGYRVLVAHDAATGLALAREERPVLITLDPDLADTDGLTLLEWLKRDAATTAIPVLLISIRNDEERGLRLGAVDRLAKPVSERALLDRVRAILDDAGPVLPQRLLVASGDAGSRALLAGGLRWGGYDVLEAEDGEALLLLAREEAPDLIICGDLMPARDIVELLGTLRAEQATATIPVIMMAPEGGASEEQRAAIEAVGATLWNRAGSPEELAMTLGGGARDAGGRR